MIVLSIIFGAMFGALVTKLFNLHTFEKGKLEGEKHGYRIGIAVGYFKGQDSKKEEKEVN